MADNICDSCIYQPYFPVQQPCLKCVKSSKNDIIPTGKFYKKKKTTNADKIKQMSNEELAFFLTQGCDPISLEECNRHIYPDYEEGIPTIKSNCYECWFEWLNEENRK